MLDPIEQLLLSDSVGSGLLRFSSIHGYKIQHPKYCRPPKFAYKYDLGSVVLLPSILERPLIHLYRCHNRSSGYLISKLDSKAHGDGDLQNFIWVTSSSSAATS